MRNQQGMRMITEAIELIVSMEDSAVRDPASTERAALVELGRAYQGMERIAHTRRNLASGKRIHEFEALWLLEDNAVHTLIALGYMPEEGEEDNPR